MIAYPIHYCRKIKALPAKMIASFQPRQSQWTSRQLTAENTFFFHFWKKSLFFAAVLPLYAFRARAAAGHDFPVVLMPAQAGSLMGTTAYKPLPFADKTKS
jgi:hypothetical protein